MGSSWLKSPVSHVLCLNVKSIKVTLNEVIFFNLCTFTADLNIIKGFLGQYTQCLFFHLMDGNMVFTDSNKNADTNFERNRYFFLFPKIVITVTYKRYHENVTYVKLSKIS